MLSSSGKILVALMCSTVAFGQAASQRSPNTFRLASTATTANYSPQVHQDRTVTFAFYAPQASNVELRFQAGEPASMTQDGDGVWRSTVGPLEPEIYVYNFIVDGVGVVDAYNPNVKMERFGPGRSIIEIPGSPPRFDERINVPHGVLHSREYFSNALNLDRRIFVYVPPDYDDEPARRFPVLYLLHGNGDDESSWNEVGRAGVILDNLLSQRKAVPMIIVMPNGYPNSKDDPMTPAATETMGKELMNEVIPMIEKNYRVAGGSDNRAIAGLSMGGGQAFLTGLRNLDKFSWVAEFSSGVLSEIDFQIDKAVPGLLNDPVAANRRLRLLFISCGTDDPRYPGHLDLVDTLRTHNISLEWFSTAGAHEWKVWRHSLAELLPRLFKSGVAVR